MKVVILAGGYGTRLAEETKTKPKCMVEIGGKPMIWHMMNIFSKQGFNEFIICAGYKQELIKQYFVNYYINNCDVTFNLSNNSVEALNNNTSPWKVTIVDTGLNTKIGGRIKRIEKYLNNERFILSNGDMVFDTNIKKLLKTHEEMKKEITITTYKASQSKGVIECDDKGNVLEFREKNSNDGHVINMGLYVCEPTMLDYFVDDNSEYENDCLTVKAKENKIAYYMHNGSWHCMDTLKEKEELEEIWRSKNCFWR